ncbi:DUF397 domain-containing protein [Actinomadura macrotermitis]|uniref:DUF397 domain-containing protein n=1 Tax=Actinomadura macrotermitis TaxID=2585200 RepID=A0A7K0C039_9ACTN|nr:DUF397 domain-containing protein [Actinomadura macrotermitis]MQY06810.1 hypothetical protein [Actinomadura macrotermitis]
MSSWRKARRSDDQGGHCVELAATRDAVIVRDSKAPENGYLVFDRAALRAAIGNHL